MLPLEFQNFIKKDAQDKYPNECCGLIFENGEITSCRNVSDTLEKSFVIDTEELEKNILNYITGFYHSHKDYPEFSVADIAFSEKLKKICVLYVVDLDTFKEYHPNGMEIPYEGRPFFFGHLDCFSLFQDYYRRELNINIILPVINHPKRYDIKYWQTKEALIEFDKLGRPAWIHNFLMDNNFTKVDDLKKYDILVFKAPNIPFPSHVAIYLDNNQILHHFFEYSARENYSNAFKRMNVGVYRHQSLI